MDKLKTIIAWTLIILFSPWLLITGLLVVFFKLFEEIFKEMARITDYQIIPYVRWKFHDVRKAFRKKDRK